MAVQFLNIFSGNCYSEISSLKSQNLLGTGWLFENVQDYVSFKGLRFFRENRTLVFTRFPITRRSYSSSRGVNCPGLCLKWNWKFKAELADSKNAFSISGVPSAEYLQVFAEFSKFWFTVIVNFVYRKVLNRVRTLLRNWIFCWDSIWVRTVFEWGFYLILLDPQLLSMDIFW